MVGTPMLWTPVLIVLLIVVSMPSSCQQGIALPPPIVQPRHHAIPPTGQPPNVNHGTRSNVNHGTRSNVNHGTRSNVNHGTRPNVNHGTRSNVNHGTRPNVNHGTRPNVNHGTRSNVNHGTRSNVNHGTRPNVNQGTRIVFSPRPESNSYPGPEYNGNPGPKFNGNPVPVYNANRGTKVFVSTGLRHNGDHERNVNRRLKTNGEKKLNPATLPASRTCVDWEKNCVPREHCALIREQHIEAQRTHQWEIDQSLCPSNGDPRIRLVCCHRHSVTGNSNPVLHSTSTNKEPQTDSAILSQNNANTHEPQQPNLNQITPSNPYEPQQTKPNPTTPNQPHEPQQTKSNQTTPSNPHEPQQTKPNQTTPSKPHEPHQTKSNQIPPSNLHDPQQPKLNQTTATNHSNQNQTQPLRATPVNHSNQNSTKPLRAAPVNHINQNPTKPLRAAPVNHSNQNPTKPLPPETPTSLSNQNQTKPLRATPTSLSNQNQPTQNYSRKHYQTKPNLTTLSYYHEPLIPQSIHIMPILPDSRFTSNQSATDVPSENDSLYTTCGQTGFSKRIFGGSEAALGMVPWQALLGYQKKGVVKYSCGGVIILPSYVLTAAHCVQTRNNIAPTTVRLGEHDLTNHNPCLTRRGVTDCIDHVQNFPVENTWTHEQYDSSTYANDIAIIKLQGIVQMSEYVRPVCLPLSTIRGMYSTSPPAYYTVSGFGDTEDRKGSDTLQHLRVPLVDNHKCREDFFKNYQFSLPANLICAGGVVGEDSCVGDSGGPLTYSSPDNGQEYLVGVVSFGVADCGGEQPAFYTDVQHFIHWIRSIIGGA